MIKKIVTIPSTLNNEHPNIKEIKSQIKKFFQSISPCERMFIPDIIASNCKNKINKHQMLPQ